MHKSRLYLIADRMIKNKLTIISIVLSFLLLAAGIAAASAHNSVIAADKVPTKSTTYYPQPIDDVLINPYMGIAPQADETSISAAHSLVYAGVSWKELEPVKGQYDFTSFEERINYAHWKEKNIKIILRIYLDYPGDDFHTDIPDWLYYETNKDGIWYKGSYGKGFSPNYANPQIIYYHEKLIKALADRYKNDNAISFIELGSIGHWGEWHTQTDARYKVPFPSESIYNQYAQHYLKYFPSKYLLIRRPLRIAVSRPNVGLYNDSFGDVLQTEEYFIKWYQNGYFDQLTKTKQPAMPVFWKSAPSGGEFATVPGENCLDDASIARTAKQMTASHTSWLGPNVPLEISDTKRQKNWNTLLKKMGYRFVIRTAAYTNQVQAGAKVKINWVVENTGTAPFYFKWPVEWSLSDTAQGVVTRYQTNDDIRKWMPGITKTSSLIQIPGSLPYGNYNLCLAILDPASNKPGINLAIAGKRTDKRYTIGQLYLPMPAPWDFIDLISGGKGFYVSSRNGIYSVGYPDNDSDNNQPGSPYIYRIIKSDASMTVRVDNPIDQTWDHMGIMFRDNTKQSIALVINKNNQIELITNSKGSENQQIITQAASFPVYLKLVKKADQYQAYAVSANNQLKGIPTSTASLDLGVNPRGGVFAYTSNAAAKCSITFPQMVIQ